MNSKMNSAKCEMMYLQRLALKRMVEQRKRSKKCRSMTFLPPENSFANAWKNR